MAASSCLRWLKVASGLAFVVGLVAAAASSPATAGPWLWLFDLLAWPVDGNPAGFDDAGLALNAVLGGVMAGWAALMYLVVAHMHDTGNHELGRPLLVSVVVWFVIDSAGSLVAGLPGNVVLNAGFLAMFVPPLVLLLRAEPSHSPRESDA